VGREDEEALGEALLQLAGDGPRRASMGEAGRQRVRARFSLAAMADGYARVCLED
jgi:glycosyltransferase involved in cell wall biosynthesis